MNRTIKLFVAGMLTILAGHTFAQDGVRISDDGTNAAPDNSAVLDVNSTDRGVLIPRMTEAQRTAIGTPGTPPTGLLVYQIDHVANTTPEGFWYYDGSAWVSLNSGAGSDNDWHETGGTAPDDINDHVYTMGRIGVGLSVPSYKLHVASENPTDLVTNYSARFDGKVRIAANNAAIEFWDPTDATRSGYIQGHTAAGMRITNELDSPIRFETNGTERMLLSNTGNLGIGTSTPNARLSLSNHASGIPQLMVDPADQDPTFFNSSTIKSLGSIILDFDNNDNLSTQYFGVTTANGTERMRITKSGNMGIGTSAPLARLHVDGDLRVGAYTLPSTDGTANQVLQTDGSGNVSWTNTSGGADVDWFDDGTNLESKAGANVGIGKVPVNTHRLDVDGYTRVTTVDNGFPQFGSSLQVEGFGATFRATFPQEASSATTQSTMGISANGTTIANGRGRVLIRTTNETLNQTTNGGIELERWGRDLNNNQVLKAHLELGGSVPATWTTNSNVILANDIAGSRLSLNGTGQASLISGTTNLSIRPGDGSTLRNGMLRYQDAGSIGDINNPSTNPRTLVTKEWVENFHNNNLTTGSFIPMTGTNTGTGDVSGTVTFADGVNEFGISPGLAIANDNVDGLAVNNNNLNYWHTPFVGNASFNAPVAATVPGVSLGVARLPEYQNPDPKDSFSNHGASLVVSDRGFFLFHNDFDAAVGIEPKGAIVRGYNPINGGGGTNAYTFEILQNSGLTYNFTNAQGNEVAEVPRYFKTFYCADNSTAGVATSVSIASDMTAMISPSIETSAPAFPVFLGGYLNSANAGITNSVILGGNDIDADMNNTAFARHISTRIFDAPTITTSTFSVDVRNGNVQNLTIDAGTIQTFTMDAVSASTNNSSRLVVHVNVINNTTSNFTVNKGSNILKAGPSPEILNSSVLSGPAPTRYTCIFETDATGNYVLVSALNALE